jgi:hypothetical protein
MFAGLQRPYDAGEGLELLLLGAEKWLRLEERDHLGEEVIPVPHDEHQTGVTVAAMVLSYPSAAESQLDQVEDLTPLGVLADVKFRYESPTDPRARISLDGDVEGTFSVDVTRNVGIQSFLLIDRTCRIFTVHCPKGIQPL